MNKNGNSYFDSPNDPEYKETRPKVYGWVYVLAVIGVIVTIVESYFQAAVNVGMMAGFNNVFGDFSIEDTNGPDDFSLCTLDFTDCIYRYDKEYGYNEFDYPCYAYTYNTNAKSYNGTFKNEYDSLPVSLNVSFTDLNYYDVCYVRPPSETGMVVRVSFSSQIKKGNLTGLIIRLNEYYTGKTDENNDFVIDSYPITKLTSFSANETVSLEHVFYPGSYYIFVVAAEGATGNYSLSISENN